MKTRVDVLRVLEARGWQIDGPVTYRKGVHCANVYVMVAAMTCACCSSGEVGFGEFAELVARVDEVRRTP